MPDTNNSSVVYQELTRHQQDAARWNWNAVVVDLHRWGELFRLRFKLEIPLPALRLSRLRIETLGHYCGGFNQFGLQNEIAISTRHIEECIANGKWWRVVGTVLHEHLHLWQQVHGKSGKRNYHNVQFQKRAAEFGLIVNHKGQTQYAPESPFMDLLRQEGIEVPSIPIQVMEERGVGESKLKKWSCGCTNVRVAVSDFQAVCLKCNCSFNRVV